MSLLNELASSGLNEAHLWTSLVIGLRNARLSFQAWAAFLDFVGSTVAPHAFFEAVTDLLSMALLVRQMRCLMS